LGILQAATASAPGGDAPAVQNVVQGLCLELTNESLSPEGLFAGCEAK